MLVQAMSADQGLQFDVEDDAITEEAGGATKSATREEQETLWQGLDPSFRPVVATLISREYLSRSEFEQFAREHGLIVMATMDAINEWSDEMFGDLLIVDGDPLQINTEIANEIEAQP